MPFNIAPELVCYLMEQNASLLQQNQNEKLTVTVMEPIRLIRELLLTMKRMKDKHPAG